jgi:Methyltransferase domain
MKAMLKQLVGPKWELRIRQLRRLRWITKYRLMRSFKTDVGVLRRLSYVLFDPELESFSFALADEPGVIAALALALGYSEHELAGYAAETHTDPELNERLARHVRWRLDFKRRMPLGSRLAGYVTTRALKPELVVETGIYMGLGSLVLLRALERNAQEGHAGELMSFDVNPLAGRLVREELRSRWHRVIGLTNATLPQALRGRRVGILFHDTAHTEETQRHEFEAALAHAAPRLLLVDGSGGYIPTLEELCRERAGSYHRVLQRSRAHVHPGGELRFAVFATPPR